MGHLAAKQPYHKLREKLDRLPVGAPGGKTILEILRTVFSRQEAELAASMPLKLTKLRSLSRKLGIPEAILEPQLDAMADKGLVMDVRINGDVRYMVSPTMVGFFEFTMMRVRDDIDQKHLAELIHRYVLEEPDFFGQFNKNSETSLFRTLVHEETIPSGSYTEVLDWERASHVVREAGKWGIGLCHCRHVEHHRGHDCEKLRMDVCMSLGFGADYLIRHGLTQEVSCEEALDVLTESREAGVVHMCDNVQNGATYICNCCGCCCEALNGLKKFDVPGNLFSSNFEARVAGDQCNGCRKCFKACPVDAIQMVEDRREVKGKRVKFRAEVSADSCLGCGVCALACPDDAMSMAPRPKRRVTPESTFERILRTAIEQGKLHELLVDRDEGMGAHAANAMLGALMNLPPGRQMLAQEALKSRFVAFLLGSAKKMGLKESSLS